MTSNSPTREDALLRSPGGKGGGRGQQQKPRRGPLTLGRGRNGQAAGHVPAGPGAHPAGALGGRCSSSARTAHPTGAPSATLLLTPSALLIDVNGSLRSSRNLFLVIWKFQVKKKKNPGAAVGSLQPGMPIRTPPPSRLHPPSQPPTCCRGGQKSIRSRSGRARRQTKTSPRAGPESGFALKAVTCQWHCREGVLHVVYLQRILLGHPKILKSETAREVVP